MVLCTGVVYHLLWNDSETSLSADCFDNSRVSQSALPAAHLQWAYEYESGSDSDADRPDPDLVLDDLASRRFHSPSPAPPTNFAVPISPLAAAAGRSSAGGGGPWPKVTMTPNVAPQQNVTCLRSENSVTVMCLPDESKVERFSYPQFAWLMVTMSNIFGCSLLPLTVLRSFPFVGLSCFELQHVLIL